MKIESITISTSNINETEQFYSDQFALKLLYKSDSELHYQAGQSVLKFIHSPTVPSIYHYAFNIPSNLLDSALLWASKRFTLIKNPLDKHVTTFENWNAQALYFYDNNGNLLEFIARYDLANPASNHEFDASKLSCISEIGIVTEEPLSLAKSWISEYHLNYFTKSPPTKDFLALGDDEGLLILVSPNRNWYPTTILAKKTPVKIKLENRGKSLRLETTICDDY